MFNIDKHWFDIYIHSLRRYNKILNSKLFRFITYLGLHTGSFDSPIGLWLELSSPSDFDKNELEKLGSENLKRLARKCKLHLFQKAKTCTGREAIFIGILVTHEDYYYILMDECGNKWYESCVGKIEFITNKK